MSITSRIYNQYFYQLASGSSHLLYDTHTLDLMLPTYVPDYANSAIWGDVSAFVVSDPSYVPNALSNQNTAISTDGTSFVLSSDDVVWSGLTATFRYVVMHFITTGSGLPPEQSPLELCIDLGDTQTVTGADFTLSFPDGALVLKVA